MSQLEELQRRVAAVVMQPLTKRDGMRQRMGNGRSTRTEAEELIKPNKRLSSFERLEIYNRQYWFRVLSSFTEDFPGLRAITGSQRFEGLMRAYLVDCPSVSYTLRNLGSKLEEWLLRHPNWIAGNERLALDMVRLEWAHIEAFDAASEPVLTPSEIEAGGLLIRMTIQPYVRLLELAYSVDDLLIEVHNSDGGTDTSSNAARLSRLRTRVKHYAKPQPKPIYLALHRLENTVYYKPLQVESYRMLRAFEENAGLEEAIERAFEDSSLTETERLAALQEWFGNWAQLGWFCRPDSSSI